MSWGLSFFLFLFSWFIVAFGQPSSFPLIGLFAAVFGFSLFFRVLIDVSSPKQRFFLGSLWYGLVLMVQLSWSFGHPFSYIYFVYAFHVVLFGLQFGVFSLFVTKKQVSSIVSILGLAGLWVLFEWSRLFFLSGHPWNPIGLALSGNFYSRQLASLWGVYGLSFWVMATNLGCLRVWMNPSRLGFSLVLALVATPYVFGLAKWETHRSFFQGKAAPYVRAGLVQTAFPIEELIPVGRQELFDYVKDEWRQIVQQAKIASDQDADLIVLPELVVPYGTFFLLYDYEEAKSILVDIFGESAEPFLPQKERHLAKQINGEWKVNNAFWLQAIANVTQADVIAGLEDRDCVGEGRFRFHTVAYLFRPFKSSLQRYEKRILVPMGEYIPFSFLRDLAADYGISGSFSPGTSAKVFESQAGALSVSICFEETMGNMIREGRLKGADMLVNVTNDGWFPDYGLPVVHLEHSRLRTVETGAPLIRSCNTGVTSAVDSFGQTIAVFGESQIEQEKEQGVLVVDVPQYAYSTLYTRFGDRLILSLSSLCLLLWLWSGLSKIRG